MSKKFFKQAQSTPNTYKAPEAIKPIEPVLELGNVENTTEESGAVEDLGVIENPAELPVTPEFKELNTYIVTAQGGLVLRESAPVDTNSTNGSNAGAGILCIAYGDTFVETKRSNNWSYGNYNGKSGWVCNIYLAKK